MSEPYVKGAVDLFLDDVAKRLEDCITGDGILTPHEHIGLLARAVLYLSRAVRSMHDENIRSPLLAAHATGLQDRISLALAHLKSRQIDIQEVVRILEGG